MDERFGEQTAMSVEDRMMARFTVERQKHHSKQTFNLEEDVLTHKGQSIEGMDEFEDIYSSGDDDGENWLSFLVSVFIPICLPLCLSVHLFVCLYVCLSTYLYVCMSVCLYVCLWCELLNMFKTSLMFKRFNTLL